VPQRIFITVAERSADTHAANLVRALRTLLPDVEVHALGGDALRSAGAIVHHDTVAGATMGLKAFKRSFEVMRLLKWTRAFYQQSKPDLHICCDSWTMNKHFAALAKQHGTKVLWYIAPQAWGSRAGRVKQLAKIADHLACILPFEKEFFEQRGMKTTFVGQPLFDDIRRDPSIVPTHFPTIALPCGSRAGVARANLPRQLAVADRIARAFPDAKFVIPTTPQTDSIARSLAGHRTNVTIEQDSFDTLVPTCHLAITVSGTATLHLAAHNVPMIVVYAASKLLWHTIGKRLVKIRTFAQVNLIAAGGRDDRAQHIVPEFIPWFGPVDAVADCAIDLLRHPEKLNAQRQQLARVIDTVGQSGASSRAAQLAIELLK
jgi:lipid-A-disaccharide synthase